MCRETPPIYIDILFLYGLTLEKKGKKRGVGGLCFGGGGCGFFVGWFVFCCGQAACGAAVCLGWEPRKVYAFPPRFTFVEVGSRKPKFLADTMFLLVDVSSLLLHMT